MRHLLAVEPDDMATLDRAMRAYTGTIESAASLGTDRKAAHQETTVLTRLLTDLQLHERGTCDCPRIPAQHLQGGT